MSVSVALLRPLAAELVRRRIDPWGLLREIDVDVAKLADSRLLVPWRALESWTRRLLELTHEPAFCLYAGSLAPMASLNSVESLLLSCDSLRDALATFARYAGVFVPCADCNVTEDSARVSLSLSLRWPSQPLAEYASALTYRLFHSFVPREALPHCEMHFPYAAPRHAPDYRAVFGCPVYFAARIHALVLPAALLDRVNPDADPTMRAIFAEFHELIAHQRRGQSSAERIQLALRHGLIQDRPTVTSVASAIGTTPRALRRKLRAVGTSVSSVIGEERGRYAARELARNVPIKDLSDDLGFSEPSAFHRAFKRWTGLTPSQFRRLQSQHQAPVGSGEPPG